LSSQETGARRVPELSFRPSRRLFKLTRSFLLVKSAPGPDKPNRKARFDHSELPSRQLNAFSGAAQHTREVP
jgi:hypothetical protein